MELPQFGLRAYALFYSRHGLRESFKQSELDWIVSQSMRKKIFFLLLRAGWISKISRNSYRCVAPESAVKELLQFRVPEAIKKAVKPYAFTGLSAVEIWSDFAYVQRGFEKSPYFIKVLEKDLRYWKAFFNEKNIPNYVNKGSTMGEYIILIPCRKIKSVIKEGLSTEQLKETMRMAKENSMYAYAYHYMRKKYGVVAG